MRGFAAVVAVAALAHGVSALYTAADKDVVQVTDKDFDKVVVKGSGLHLVEFYAPWCGHCKNLAPEWKKAAKALKGMVSVVAVDCDAHKSIGGKYGVQGFPTIKLFIEGKAEPVDYTGAREAPAIVSWAMGQASSLAKARLSGKSSGGSSSGGGGSKGGAKPKASGGGGGHGGDGPGSGAHVVELTPENFDELVLGGGDAPWFVEFYAPWCGHCKSLAPEWASAAEAMVNEGVKFGAVDADKHGSLGQRFGVKGFPTIKTFAAGASSDSAAQDYNGPRTSEGLIAAATALAGADSGKPGKVTQITGKASWEEVCSGKIICVAAVLPHILDDAASKRTSRLSILAEAAGKARGKPIRVVWWEVGTHPALEGALGVGMVPAVYAIVPSKGVFTPHKGALELQSVIKFLGGLTSLKGAPGTTPLPKDFDVAKALTEGSAWDGKDGVLPTEDEEPLECGGGDEGLCTARGSDL